MEIRDLSQVSPERVIDAFEAAFGDYAVAFDRRQIESMLGRRGYNPALSFAAFDNEADGGIAAFILNGTGEYAGVTTCYDCGTGTLPAYRGRGLAGSLFRHSLPLLRKAGIKRYLLEVLKDNAPAIALYRANGFAVTADYDCYSAPIGEIALRRPLRAAVTLRQVTVDVLAEMQACCDFTPSWQNSLESIARGIDGLRLLGAFTADGRCVGYCVTDESTGDVAQIAVAQSMRRQGIASAMLADALAHMATTRIKVLNVDTRCTSLPAFLGAVGVAPSLPQYAMTLRL